MDETTNSNWAPWDNLESDVSAPQFDQGKIIEPQGTSRDLDGADSGSTSEAKELKSASRITSAKLRLIYGADLKSNPRFCNAIDGKKLDDSALFFTVSPYAFARRSMMRTATVRTLLMDKKLPRLIDSHDQLMVVVSLDWVTGKASEKSLEELGFNPEDYLDAE